MTSVVPLRWEVERESNWPRQDVHYPQPLSPLRRRINAIVRALARLGIEPEQITVDIDRRAVIVRAQEQIHLRAL